MAYNAEDDECLWSDQTEGEQGTITVGVYSYRGGKPKIGLNRRVVTKRGANHSGIGRMTSAEVERVIPLLQAAVKELKCIG